jgi:hypothetical protein
MKLLNSMLKSSKRAQSKLLCSTFNFLHRKLEAKFKFLTFGMFTNSSRMVEHKNSALNFQLSAPKVGGRTKKFCVWPLMDFPSSVFKGPMKGRAKKFALSSPENQSSKAYSFQRSKSFLKSISSM